MLAVNLIRSNPPYRRDAFSKGLERAGYRLSAAALPTDKRDVLLIWNRYGMFEQRADAWEAAGGTVLVAENGYIGLDDEGRQLYAISVHGHNGSGWYPDGESPRFAKLGIRCLPFRRLADGYALICGQRGIGTRLMASPPLWHDRTAAKLHPPVKVRLHPGDMPKPAAPATTLAEDLAGARECVIWSSSSGVAALTLGIPVVYAAPHWVCSRAATPLRQDGGYDVNTNDDDRMAALERMSWGQWRVAEIESGEPFIRILENLESAKW